MHQNPFRYSGSVSGNGFTSRTEDLMKLRGYMLSGDNSIILSHNRWGKTSLLLKSMDEVALKSKKLITACFNLEDGLSEHLFFQSLANALMKAVAKSEEDYLQLASQIFESLRPEVFLNTEHKNGLSMGFNWEALEEKEHEVLNMPERLAEISKSKILLCIDSFHNIAGIEDPLKLLKKIREQWCKHERVNYAFAANSVHPFRAWVNEPSGPLYGFAQSFFLHPIPDDELRAFIVNHFTNTSKYISDEIAGEIVKISDSQVALAQHIAHKVWENSGRSVPKKLLNDVIESLLSESDTEYRTQVLQYSTKRLNYLKFVCLNQSQKATSPANKQNEADKIKSFRAGFRFFERKGVLFSYKASVKFTDPLFAIWLKRKLWGINN